MMFRERELDEEGEREERDEEREGEGAPRIARPLVTNWFVVLITMMKMDRGKGQKGLLVQVAWSHLWWWR